MNYTWSVKIYWNIGNELAVVVDYMKLFRNQTPLILCHKSTRWHYDTVSYLQNNSFLSIANRSDMSTKKLKRWHYDIISYLQNTNFISIEHWSDMSTKKGTLHIFEKCSKASFANLLKHNNPFNYSITTTKTWP
jgi:hypothetical protein